MSSKKKGSIPPEEQIKTLEDGLLVLQKRIEDLESKSQTTDFTELNKNISEIKAHLQRLAYVTGVR